MDQELDRDRGASQRIGIVGDALAPRFNEACAKQMRLLSQELNAPVLTCADIGLAPFKKLERYFIVNGRYLREDCRRPILTWANGAFFYPFLKLFERKRDAIVLSGSVNSGFLPYLDLRKCTLIINSLPFSVDDPEAHRFAERVAPRLGAAVAQSKRVRDGLLGMGLDAPRVRLAYPWVDLEALRPTEPPPLDEFRILFASAPNAEMPGRRIFEDKGIPLLLEAFRTLASRDRAVLRLLWRGYHRQDLWAKIRELHLEDSVEVVDRVADVSEFLSDSHIVVVPFRGTRRSPEMPLSAIEALACGRPVVSTDVAEIAEVVQTHECGAVARPEVADLATALEQAMKEFWRYQGNCRRVAEDMFKPDFRAFLDL